MAYLVHGGVYHELDVESSERLVKEEVYHIAHGSLLMHRQIAYERSLAAVEDERQSAALRAADREGQRKRRWRFCHGGKRRLRSLIGLIGHITKKVERLIGNIVWPVLHISRACVVPCLFLSAEGETDVAKNGFGRERGSVCNGR